MATKPARAYRDQRNKFSASRPSSICPPDPRVNIAQPLGLPLGRLAAVHGPADHVVDELLFFLALETIALGLAFERDLVPGRTVDIVKSHWRRALGRLAPVGDAALIDFEHLV